ncbi:MAG: restriction endonuclease subunit S [Muribaculaceae bacterium]|nr:restriction endonuclease subunit S [Muribaculaceae bacterium]
MEREMKDSGIPWIGEIPKDWEKRKMRTLGDFTASGIDKKIIENEHLLKIINYVDVYNNTSHELRNDKEYMVVSASLDKINEHKIKIGDLIFTPSSETKEDIGMSAVVMEDIPNTAYSYHVIRFRQNNSNLIDLKYSKYLCNNALIWQYFSSNSNGTIRQTLSREVFKECEVLLPPLQEQKAIAEFLDKKCGEIDELVTLQNKMIEELKAYKQSIISETVTGKNHIGRTSRTSLQPIPMKDSGIEWIGEIPQHWKVSKLKYYIEIGSGDGISKENILEEGLYPVFGGGEMIGYLNNSNVKALNIIIGRVGARCGCITLLKEDAWATDNSLICKTNQNPYFLSYLLVGYNLNRLNESVAQPLITSTKIKNISIGLPTLSEQQEIADFLDKKCSEIDSLIELKQQKIEELKDYKKSIIYEYVTGKKSVGTWRAMSAK